MLSQNLNSFSKESLEDLLSIVEERRAILFGDPAGGILLRHDIDDDIEKAVRIAEMEEAVCVRATFFILNTADYWRDERLFDHLRYIQNLGHEIAWHNNIITEWIRSASKMDVSIAIRAILNAFRDNGVNIHGSASHGDALCRRWNYLNYEVFNECPRTEEAKDFPICGFGIPKVNMEDLGLEWEAYHVPYDLYLSESGGKKWTGRVGATSFTSFKESDLQTAKRVQILIHPQWWNI